MTVSNRSIERSTKDSKSTTNASTEKKKKSEVVYWHHKGVDYKPRKYQDVFLRILGQCTGPVDKGYLIRKVNQDYNLEAEYDYVILHSVGSNSPESREKLEKKLGHPSLITYGFVTFYDLIIEGRQTVVYEITDKGRDALSKLPKVCRWAK